ncbi:MAG: hypothetical protein WC390_08755, partial [Sulfurimonas sp.]
MSEQSRETRKKYRNQVRDKLQGARSLLDSINRKHEAQLTHYEQDKLYYVLEDLQAVLIFWDEQTNIYLARDT